MSGQGFHQKGNVVLECGHTVIYTVPLPPLGAEAYCRYCNDYSSVMQSGEVYYAKCNSGKCRLNKGHGADKDAAVTTARKHVQRYTRHKVTVLNGRVPIVEVTNTEETLFATAESRAVVAADTQKLLRDFARRGTAKPHGMG